MSRSGQLRLSDIIITLIPKYLRTRNSKDIIVLLEKDDHILRTWSYTTIGLDGIED